MAKKKKLQNKAIYIRVSEDFRKGLEKAANEANEPSLSEWIKRVMIREALKYNIEIKR